MSVTKLGRGARAMPPRVWDNNRPARGRGKRHRAAHTPHHNTLRDHTRAARASTHTSAGGQRGPCRDGDCGAWIESGECLVAGADVSVGEVPRARTGDGEAVQLEK